MAVKSTMAYHRDLDCLRTPAEDVEKAFLKKMASEPLSPAERKALEDHLFWYAVDRATAHGPARQASYRVLCGPWQNALAEGPGEPGRHVRTLPGVPGDAVRVLPHLLPLLRRDAVGRQALPQCLRGHVLVVDHQSRGRQGFPEEVPADGAGRTRFSSSAETISPWSSSRGTRRSPGRGSRRRCRSWSTSSG